MLPSHQFYVYLGIIFLIISGAPLPLRDDPQLSKAHIILSTVCCSAQTFDAIIIYYRCYNAWYTSKNNPVIPTFAVVLALYTTLSIIVIVVMVLSWKTFNSMFMKMVGLEQLSASATKRNLTTNAFVKFVLTLIFLLTMVLDAFNVITDNLNRHFEEFHKVMAFIMLFMICTPGLVMYWSFYYHLTHWYLTEIDLHKRLNTDMFGKQTVQKLNTVLPAIDIVLPLVNRRPYCIEQESNPCTSTSRNFMENQCKCALKNYCVLKNLCYNMNRSFYMLIALNMLPKVAFASLLNFGEYYFFQGLLWNDTLMFIFQLVIIFALITSNQWAKHCNKCLKTKTFRDVYNTKDAIVKKACIKMVASATDEYPDSPCFFFEFNISLVSNLVDAAVLTLTTFFVPTLKE